jgi:type IV pilus assembly protein PilP
MVKRLHIFFLVAFLPFLLISCGSQEEQAVVPVKRPKPAAAAPVAQAEAQVELHELTPASKERNPFVSHIMLLKGARTAKKIKGPLECCEVDQFKLLAVIVAPTNSSALLQAPDGKRYIVKNGDVLGSREGRIIRIRSGSLTVRERMLDEAGKVVSTADVELALPVREEDKKFSR